MLTYLQDSREGQRFALKQLTSPNEESFNQELGSMLTFQEEDDQHLIKLLVSFEIRTDRERTFYFLYPWADGNLWRFWESNDETETRRSLADWMALECYRLAQGLMHVHNERENGIRTMPSIPENEHELYGRHGDIKAENILWYRRQHNKLVISDFGLGRFHTKISRSNQDPKTLARTETYRAPEFDTPDGKISRKSDIFSLGCMFLEFMTWFLEGFASVDEEFVTFRTTPDNLGFNTDTFFSIRNEAGGIKTPIIKPQINEWIQRLRKNKRSTQYTQDFLDLVKRMLEPEVKSRASSNDVVKRLHAISRTCRVDSSYARDSK